jgi:hypothetical protein
MTIVNLEWRAKYSPPNIIEGKKIFVDVKRSLLVGFDI